MKRTDFRFAERLRIRWAEVDMQKIVFNGHYLLYFDTAVAGYWRALALPYHETMDQLEGDLFVRKATLEYVASARYDDLCEVGIRCARIGKSSIVFAAAMFRDEQLLVHGELVYVFADPVARTSRPVPPPLRAALEALERGEPMVELRLGSWDELGAEARRIRRQVFIDEQKIPAPLDEDPADARAVHAVAFNRLGLAVATGRWVEVADGSARIGRLAVAAALRGSGHGVALLEALLASARERGMSEAMLHARQSAVRFYERAGFVVRGLPFEEAGLVHLELARTL
ncbi:MAG: YbgC/FadM family acyl-CoA thioesterase [Burkholderiales bacterium]|nr:YbgC/FadM family acyl-CoA thioesterase [Burkholderiales bacterium]MDE2456010.1 YbgC/FadM family acyl-CoA thioesterase [Burkholderiales bacterium]